MDEQTKRFIETATNELQRKLREINEGMDQVRKARERCDEYEAWATKRSESLRDKIELLNDLWILDQDFSFSLSGKLDFNASRDNGDVKIPEIG